jgi:hypothetical protein
MGPEASVGTVTQIESTGGSHVDRLNVNARSRFFGPAPATAARRIELGGTFRF